MGSVRQGKQARQLEQRLGEEKVRQHAKASRAGAVNHREHQAVHGLPRGQQVCLVGHERDAPLKQRQQAISDVVEGEIVVMLRCKR